MNDPRPSNPYKKLYMVEYLNNMVGGRPVLYINQEAEVLKKAAAESIRKSEVSSQREFKGALLKGHLIKRFGISSILCIQGVYRNSYP